MVSIHRLFGTWTRLVDQYFTLTEAARQKFIEGGFPPERILVKPNFLDPDPGIGKGDGGYAVFVGRLSAEKGVAALLECWTEFQVPLPLRIIGDGPLASQVQEAAAHNDAITWLGHQTRENVLTEVGNATFLVMPSLWYETFGRTIIEAFARGTPVIASGLGAMAELVDDGRAGLHFQAGNASDLASKIQQLLSDPARLSAMREAARRDYVSKYTAEPNYKLLLQIYDQARIGSRGKHVQRSTRTSRKFDQHAEHSQPKQSP